LVAKDSVSLLESMAGTTGLEPATSAVTVLPYQLFQQLTRRGERLKPPKSCKTMYFVDRKSDDCGRAAQAPHELPLSTALFLSNAFLLQDNHRRQKQDRFASTLAVSAAIIAAARVARHSTSRKGALARHM
jgi:hypothetical protein